MNEDAYTHMVDMLNPWPIVSISAMSIRSSGYHLSYGFTCSVRDIPGSDIWPGNPGSCCSRSRWCGGGASRSAVSQPGRRRPWQLPPPQLSSWGGSCCCRLVVVFSWRVSFGGKVCWKKYFFFSLLFFDQISLSLSIDFMTRQVAFSFAVFSPENVSAVSLFLLLFFVTKD